MSENENRIMNFTISDYLDLYYKKQNNQKLGMVITPKQTAYSIGNVDDHWNKNYHLSKKIFPTRNYTPMRLYEDGIWVFSVGDDLTVSLPDVIRPPYLYNCLEEFVGDVLKYEQENGVKIPCFDAEKILREARSRVSTDSYPADSDEVLITEPTEYDRGYAREVVSGIPHNSQKIMLADAGNSIPDDFDYSTMFI